MKQETDTNLSALREIYGAQRTAGSIEGRWKGRESEIRRKRPLLAGSSL